MIDRRNDNYYKLTHKWRYQYQGSNSDHDIRLNNFDILPVELGFLDNNNNIIINLSKETTSIFKIKFLFKDFLTNAFKTGLTRPPNFLYTFLVLEAHPPAP